MSKPKSFRPNEKWYEITDERLYLRRREFISKTGALVAAGAAALALMPFSRSAWAEEKPPIDLETVRKSPYSTGEKSNTYEQASTYNNFYEFGLSKEEPVRLAKNFKPRPWTLAVEGLVRKPETVDVDALIRRHSLEERIYRLRCVEAWSMVIPWIGFPLAELIKVAEPLSQAKYVEFVTLYDPGRMPGQRFKALQWPYDEGLQLDEAMNPLTILAVGMYGKVLPSQNGAPIRLIVPWKYGFKSIKSIVKIRFVQEQPKTSWSLAAPNEYGFYANVNPEVDHPRWSQKTERRIGELGHRPTLPFNGYGEYVAALYKGMDLRRYY